MLSVILKLNPSSLPKKELMFRNAWASALALAGSAKLQGDISLEAKVFVNRTEGVSGDERRGGRGEEDDGARYLHRLADAVRGGLMTYKAPLFRPGGQRCL